jgi:hypothetical protein
MSDTRNIQIDGSAFGVRRAAGAKFRGSPADSIVSWNGGIAGILPPPSALHAPPKLGPRDYTGPLGTPFGEDSPAAIDELREFVQEEEKRNFEAGVRKTLERIGSRDSGRAVLNEVGRQSHRVTITPYLPSDYRWTNGSARPLDGNWTDATRRHWLIRDNDGEPMRYKNGDRTWDRGTGAGADAIIEFTTPGLMRVLIDDLAVKKKWSAGGDRHSLAFADEILVHELVHAIRITAGFSVDRRVPRQPRYGTMEEFFAIVVANVYRSECGRGGVRNANHGEWETMQISGEYFLKWHFNRAHLRQFRRDHPNLAAELHEIDTYFNPFRHLRAANPH